MCSASLISDRHVVTGKKSKCQETQDQTRLTKYQTDYVLWRPPLFAEASETLTSKLQRLLNKVLRHRDRYVDELVDVGALWNSCTKLDI